MNGEWTHACCESCWTRDHADRRPTRLIVPEVETCCLCGATTTSGIYVRRDPAETMCGRS